MHTLKFAAALSAFSGLAPEHLSRLHAHKLPLCEDLCNYVLSTALNCAHDGPPIRREEVDSLALLLREPADNVNALFCGSRFEMHYTPRGYEWKTAKDKRKTVTFQFGALRLQFNQSRADFVKDRMRMSVVDVSAGDDAITSAHNYILDFAVMLCGRSRKGAWTLCRQNNGTVALVQWRVRGRLSAWCFSLPPRKQWERVPMQTFELDVGIMSYDFDPGSEMVFTTQVRDPCIIYGVEERVNVHHVWISNNLTLPPSNDRTAPNVLELWIRFVDAEHVEFRARNLLIAVLESLCAHECNDVDSLCAGFARVILARNVLLARTCTAKADCAWRCRISTVKNERTDVGEFLMLVTAIENRAIPCPRNYNPHSDSDNDSWQE